MIRVLFPSSLTRAFNLIFLPGRTLNVVLSVFLMSPILMRGILLLLEFIFLLPDRFGHFLFVESVFLAIRSGCNIFVFDDVQCSSIHPPDSFSQIFP